MIAGLLADARLHWERGERNRIPRCCRVRFIAATALTARLPEGPLARAVRLTPRHAVADGIVPCELHLARWLVTGRPPVAPADRVAEPGFCCDHRFVVEAEGVAEIRRDPEVGVWVLRIADEPVVSVLACPWCGRALGDA